jgi:hypothetical protein
LRPRAASSSSPAFLPSTELVETDEKDDIDDDLGASGDFDRNVSDNDSNYDSSGEESADEETAKLIKREMLCKLCSVIERKTRKDKIVIQIYQNYLPTAHLARTQRA